MVLYNVGEPMEWLEIDVLGPLPFSVSRNMYLLIAAGTFTKWLEVCLPNRAATTVAEVLVHESNTLKVLVLV